jgi:transcription antitermination factor NusG
MYEDAQSTINPVATREIVRSAPPQQWHVLHVKPRQEKALAQDLAAMEIEHYLPLMTRVHFYGTRKFQVSLPVFPGYLFIYGTIESVFATNRTRRVVRILRVANQEIFERDVQNIQLSLRENAQLDPYPFLVKGVRVEVRAGPFRGLQGIIESTWRANRLILQVEILGKAVSMEIDSSLLDPIL